MAGMASRPRSPRRRVDPAYLNLRCCMASLGPAWPPGAAPVPERDGVESEIALLAEVLRPPGDRLRCVSQRAHYRADLLMLDIAVAQAGHPPRRIVADQGVQFCEPYLDQRPFWPFGIAGVQVALSMQSCCCENRPYQALGRARRTRCTLAEGQPISRHPSSRLIGIRSAVRVPGHVWRQAARASKCSSACRIGDGNPQLPFATFGCLKCGHGDEERWTPAGLHGRGVCLEAGVVFGASAPGTSLQPYCISDPGCPSSRFGDPGTAGPLLPAPSGKKRPRQLAANDNHGSLVHGKGVGREANSLASRMIASLKWPRSSGRSSYSEAA